MSLSPVSSSSSVSASSTASSSSSGSTLHPGQGISSTLRRRSVDTGGLNLAVNDHTGSGSGRGYGGWVEHLGALPGSLDLAELVIAMREQTNSLIDQAYPATSTTFRPSSQTDARRVNYIRKLAGWHFDASHLPPDEALMCTTLLFELLWSIEGMEEDIHLAFESILPFLARVSKIYREQTSYHNFQHALDVLQAIYCYLYEAGCVPSVEILLDQEQDVGTSSSQADAGKGKRKASPASDVVPPPPRQRKFWRRSWSGGGTLLQRTLRNQDLFALFVAAIGHDIGHPGLSNAFMKNAKTPLAELFDDTSVLEKMHCTLLLQVMRKHRMGHLMDRIPSHMTHEIGFAPLSQSRARTESDPGVLPREVNGVHPEKDGDDADQLSPSTPPTPLPPRPTLKKSASAYPRRPEVTPKGPGTEFRNLLMKTILATDMSVHFQWMSKIEELIQRLKEGTHNDEDDFGRSTGEVEGQIRLLLCQALLKCADISNPSRPPPTCKHWSWSLNAEWAEQALLEEQLALPISVTASDDPMIAAAGQVEFIRIFTQPLLDVTTLIIPEMATFREQCDLNRRMWQTKVEFLKSKVDAVPNDDTPPASASSTSSPLTLPTSPPDVSTMFALSLPATLYTPSTEPRQPSWPATSDPSSSPLSMTPRPEIDDVTHLNEHLNGVSLPDSTPPSPPATAQSHHRPPSHTELPQVSIPNGPSPFTSQHAKSSSTTASASPLFSPRSIPTSSSSPRSDVSSPSATPGMVSSVLGLQFRPALRAAYDAHGRPKAMKRLENRTSWQGSAVTSPMADWGTDTVFEPQGHTSGGS